MRALIQRVKKASVTVEGELKGSIEKGLLIFLGIHKDDQPEDTIWLVKKLAQLRVFGDSEGKMNLSVQDVQGEVLIVCQFTLYGNCQNGRRPDYLESAPPDKAEALYHKFVDEFRAEVVKVATGQFRAYMEVSLVNDGPVTLLVEGK